MIRVIIVDDHDLVRSGLGALLAAEPDLDVVGVFADGRGAVDFVAEHPVDVVLMDLAMPGLDGVAATRLVREASPATAVVVLTTMPDDEHVERALRAGAIGYHLKSGSTGALVAAVREAHRGRRSYSPEVLDRLTERFVAAAEQQRPGGGVPPELASLTPRELEVLVEVGRGRTNPEIAAALHLSPTSVKTYVTRILAKLGIANRVQLVVLAFRTGLVSSDAVD
ncbi:MAG: response regulator transcription factor [Microbacteriaceae bacterium]|nr:response regulator transcription factor [Microbacteriaceae bacterium]